jgi:Protein of unknown function (DUF3147)
LQLGKLRGLRSSELAARFVFGALTSALAGIVTLVAGARAGGVFLGFPAILVASLSLLEKKDGREQTREDARGAIIGAAALATFAAVGSVLLSRTDSLLALALALASWAGVCVIGYVASQATPRRSGPRRALARLGFAATRERRSGCDRRDRPVPPRGA